MILYALIQNYLLVIVLVPIVVAILTRLYNRKTGKKVSGLSVVSLVLGVLNWQNLMAIQQFCMKHQVGGPYLSGGGSGVAYSLPVSIVAIACGHLALYHIKK